MSPQQSPPSPGHGFGHAPQSPMHVSHVSLPLHAPSPQKGAHKVQESTANPTHVASHAFSQQKGSVSQTVSQQAVSLQPTVPLALQQSPTPGQTLGQAPQSPEQISHVSLALQLPSPQNGAQSGHKSCASPTQKISHSVSQQKGSIAQTDKQQSGLSQPGLTCAAQQFSVPGQLSEMASGSACAQALQARIPIAVIAIAASGGVRLRRFVMISGAFFSCGPPRGCHRPDLAKPPLNNKWQACTPVTGKDGQAAAGSPRDCTLPIGLTIPDKPLPE